MEYSWRKAKLSDLVGMQELVFDDAQLEVCCGQQSGAGMYMYPSIPSGSGEDGLVLKKWIPLPPMLEIKEVGNPWHIQMGHTCGSAGLRVVCVLNLG